MLLKKLKSLIHDEKFYNLLETIIKITDNGIPLGFYLSQWLANWYLQDLDHYIKENLKARYYIRYMDDMVIFGPNKKELHRFRKTIETYIKQNLGLQLKENWQVFLFHYVKKNGEQKGRFLDFMGFRFYRNRVNLRRSILLRATRKAKRLHKKSKPTIYDIRQMLSYLGWIDSTNTYQIYIERIKPYVNIRRCKHRISVYDRRKNRQ